MQINPNFPVYRLVITNDATGISVTSLVDDPAHEGAFVAFSKAEPIEVRFTANKVKQNLTGPLLIPNKLIYQRDATRGEYYVFYSEEDIDNVAKQVGRKGQFTKTSIMHTDQKIDGAYTFEFWKTHTDNERGLGYPKGTLMSTVHVEDPEVWSIVERGDVKGFSIEGVFGLLPVQMSAQPTEPTDMDLMSVLLDDKMSDAEKKQAIKNMLRIEEK